MPPDPPALRRASRLLDLVIAGMASVRLGAVTRDLERLDHAEPLLAGEILLGRQLNTSLTARLLRRRGFARCGWSDGIGLHREPVYSLGHHPD